MRQSRRFQVLCMRMLIAVAAVGLVLSIISPARVEGAEAECEALTREGVCVKVMSFNIRYGTARDGDDSWPNRRQEVFKAICDQDADVIGLQEALKFQIDEILEACPQYATLGGGRDDGKDKGEFSNILYRKDRLKVDASETFWLSDTPNVPGSITWGNACTRITTWARFIDRQSGKAFYLFNLHMDHISQRSRLRSAALVAERVARREHPEDAAIVTGDFNAGEDNAAVRYLKGRHPLKGEGYSPVTLADTFRILHPHQHPAGTFNGFSGRRSGDKIDYVLVEPRTRVLSAAIVTDKVNGRYPSDHFPVVAEICLPAPAPLTASGS